MVGMETLGSIIGFIAGLTFISLITTTVFMVIALPFNAGRRLRDRRVDTVKASGKFGGVMGMIAGGIFALIMLFVLISEA